MTKFLCYILLIGGVFNACRHKTAPATPIKPDFGKGVSSYGVKPLDNEALVLIHTSVGDMKVRLFNETPKHRDNFIKLAESGFFDSLLFHRVIKNFMIQGGDPDSKNAPKDKMLGEGGPGYTVNAEIMAAKLFHKKGMLAAAREGDDVNPDKESSGSQFYIVQGKIQDDESLEKNERRINRLLIQKITDSLLLLPENSDLKNKLLRYKKEKNADSLLIVQRKIDFKVNPVYAMDKRKYSFSEEQRKIYKAIGGTPHLDGGYTVFGEVYEGLDVIERIAAAATDANDRPLSSIKMSVKVIRKSK